MTRDDLVSEWDDEPTKPIPADVVRRMRKAEKRSVELSTAGAELRIELCPMDTRSNKEVLQDLVTALQAEIARAE